MTAQHEEFEVGNELDRAVRAAVTGLAQLMERVARRSQDKTREEAGRNREEWLGQRDAARRQYLPWTSQGRVEKLHPVAAAHRWAVAAAWSGMDPTAREAEQDLARRIHATHGQYPSTLVNFTDPTTLVPDPSPATRLISMNEAHGLAVTHAPDWWTIPEDVKPLEHDRPPASAAESAFHDDWQYFTESGQLPERSQWQQWADHVGRADEFSDDKWVTATATATAGVDQVDQVDQVARDDALAQVWEEGREERATMDIAAHEAAMHRAGMGDLAAQLGTEGATGEVVQNHTWHAYLTPSRFDAAKPEDLATAWRDASAAALTGDAGAKKSADKIASLMRDRRGLIPESMLISSLAEQASHSTEARRNAEDRARRKDEAQRPTAPALAVPLGKTGSSSPTPGANATIARERVVELNHMAGDYYAGQLRPGTPGHKYFTQRLGSEFENSNWQLGYASHGWQNLTNHLRSHGASDQEMVAAGLAEHGKFGVRDVFRDRAMMGIRDYESGETVGFVGRDLSGDQRAPKVRNTGETPAFRKGDHVYGLYEAAPGARLVRVEGPFDAMAVSLASDGKAAGVTPMGTAMTQTQASAIASKANGRVWLANDSDAAGQKATEQDFFALSAMGAEVRQVDIAGSDPAAVWQESPELLRNALSDLPHSRTAAETVVDRYLADPSASPAGFRDLIERLEAHVEPIDSSLLALRATELEQGPGPVTADATSPIIEPGVVESAAERGDLNGQTLPNRELAADGNHPVTAAEATAHVRARMDEGSDSMETGTGTGVETSMETSAPYDRRDEVSGEINEHQATARDASSHGFSRSTGEQLRHAPTSKSGTPAKVQRGTDPKQTQGRTLRR